MTTVRPPRIPRILLRALDLIDRDSVAGDLLEEYAEHVVADRGRWRARWWLGRQVTVTLVVGLTRTFLRTRDRTVLTGPATAPTPRTRGTTRREPMKTLWNDTRYGMRMLAKTPGLSSVAVLTVAFGVGLTTFMFSVVYGSVIRGLPYEGADRLAIVQVNDVEDGISQMSVTYHDYVDFRDQQTTFDGLAALYQGTVNIADDAQRPERYAGAFVTANTFRQVGVQPILGRTFADGEDQPQASATIVLGYAMWQNRYAGDPDIIGRTIRANGRPHTVIGVMPRGFRFPFDEDLWVPLALDRATTPRGTGFGLDVLGRLRPGVTLDLANIELTGIAQRIAAEFPETNQGIGAFAVRYVDNYMPPQIVAVLYVMLAAVFGVLLIACSNVANLLLARASIRSKEVAIRSALGASRRRVIQQLLLEAAVLATVGGLVGIFLSYFAVVMFNGSIVDIQKPFWIDIRVDQPTLWFAIVATVVATVVSGIIPALRASGSDVHEVLKDESKGSSSFRMGRFSSALVVGEIAVSCALLISAGLMVKSVVNLRSLDMGFDGKRVFTARVGLFPADYPDSASRRGFFERMLERSRALPGVEAAALTTNLPTSGSGQFWFGVEGETYPTDRDYPLTNRSMVSPGFFDTFGVTLTQGRDFAAQDRDGSLPVAIVNQSFVDRYFDGGPALGRRIRVGRSDSTQPWLTVVGVVPDLHVGGGVGGIGSDRIPPDQLYVPVWQSDLRFLSVAARTSGEPNVIAPTLRDLVATLDSNLPLYNAMPMADVTAAATWSFGLFGSLFALFGAIALFMASVGLYGVMAFSVSRRTQEMGIRIALGAYGKDIVRLVLRKGLTQLAIGMAIGLGIGFGLSRPLQVVLFHVEVGDPSVYLLIVATLSATGIAACLVPARRATRVDVVEALRPE